MNRRNLSAPLAVAIAAALAAGCGQREEAPAAPAPTTDLAPAEPVGPPPTYAAQYETDLVGMGATLTDTGLRVTLGSADFPSGKAEFKPESTDRIDRVGGLLKERPELRVRIVGYTDDRGSRAANEKLSRERAAAVREVLMSRTNVPEDRIEVEGKGPADPVASNDTEEGRAQNRRVELVITDGDGRYVSRAALGPGGAAPTDGSMPPSTPAP